MLIQVPHGYTSLQHFQEGEETFLRASDELKEKHGIHLFTGVGSICREPLMLSQSYREARKARRTPHYNRLSLRYYEEITKNPLITSCTHYIAENCQNDLTTRQVAKQINISVPYFCRLFKKKQAAALLNMSPSSACSVPYGCCGTQTKPLNRSQKNLASTHRTTSAQPLKNMSALHPANTG